MERDLQFCLIFNDKSFPIPINFYHYQNISQNILQTLIHDQKHQYEVQTNVPEEIFQSFVDYLVNNTISGINIENFYLYFQLCEEFEISDLISRNRLGFSDYLININGLQYCKSNFIPKIEEEIAQNLDEYLINSGSILMRSPIQSLHRIFKHKKCQLTNHDLAYELIKQQYENSHDPTIFILLDFLDGSQLTKNNLEESIKLAEHRFDFMPRIDFCYLTMQFKVLEERLEKMNKKVVENKKKHSNNYILYIMSFSLALLISFLFNKINLLIETVNDQKNSIYYLNQKLFSFKEDISNLTKVIAHHEEDISNLTKVIAHQEKDISNLSIIITSLKEQILKDFVTKEQIRNLLLASIHYVEPRITYMANGFTVKVYRDLLKILQLAKDSI